MHVDIFSLTNVLGQFSLETLEKVARLPASHESLFVMCIFLNGFSGPYYTLCCVIWTTAKTVVHITQHHLQSTKFSVYQVNVELY
jgi:hypothetical protein